MGRLEHNTVAVRLPAGGVLLAWDQPTSRRGVRQVVLRAGVVDDDAVEVFGFGLCLLLACALHDVTDRPFGFVDHHRPGVGWDWAHAGVIAADGRFLDVQGARRPAEVFAATRHAMGDCPHALRLTRVEDPAGLYRKVGLPCTTSPGWWHAEFGPVGTAAILQLAYDVVARHGNPDTPPAARL